MTDRFEYIKALEEMENLKRPQTSGKPTDYFGAEDTISLSTQDQTYGELTPPVGRQKVDKRQLGAAAKKLFMMQADKARQKELAEKREQVQRNIRELYLKQKEEARILAIQQEESAREAKRYNNLKVAFKIFYHTDLLILDLSNFKMQDIDGKFISQIMFTNESLRNLDLSNNNLGSMTASELGLGLCHNTRLKKLNLSGNRLTNNGADESGIMEFFDSISVNKVLQSLDVSNNNIGQACWDVLRGALASNFAKLRKHRLDEKNTDFGLFKLSYDGNPISDANIKAIDAYIKENHMLRDIIENNSMKDLQIAKAAKGKLQQIKKHRNAEEEQMAIELAGKDKWQAAFKIKWTELISIDDEQKDSIMQKIDEEEETACFKSQVRADQEQKRLLGLMGL